MLQSEKILLAGGSFASALLLSACGMLARGDDVRYDPVMPLAAESQPVTDGAIWHDGHDIPLFENAVARNVGARDLPDG